MSQDAKPERPDKQDSKGGSSLARLIGRLLEQSSERRLAWLRRINLALGGASLILAAVLAWMLLSSHQPAETAAQPAVVEGGTNRPFSRQCSNSSVPG